MKRSFNAVVALRSRFPERFVPKRFVPNLPFPNLSFLFSSDASQLAVFSITAAVFFFLSTTSPDSYATTFADVMTGITAFSAELEAILKELVKAIIVIGLASAAVFIASSLMKWLRIIA